MSLVIDIKKNDPKTAAAAARKAGFLGWKRQRYAYILYMGVSR